MKARSILSVLVLLSYQAVYADERPTIEMRIGGYLTEFNSELQINDSADAPGTDNDLEDELDMDDGLEEVRLDLRWRFAPKHAVDFAYYDISRTGRRVIDRQLEIGDETYVIGTNLSSSLDFEVYKVSYAYAFAQSQASETALSFGLHMIDMSFQTKGRLLGLPVDRQSSEVLAPLPVVGFQYARQLSDRFMFSVDVDLFALEYDDYKGSLWDASAILDFALTDNVGAFIGYNFVELSIESDDEDFLGEVDYQYGAVTAGIKLTF